MMKSHTILHLLLLHKLSSHGFKGDQFCCQPMWLPFAANPCGCLLVAEKTSFLNQAWCRKARGFKTYPMGLKFGYVILDTHWNNFYEERIPIGAVEVRVLDLESWLPNRDWNWLHFISFLSFCFTCMHMLSLTAQNLISSSKVICQFNSHVQRLKQRCLSSFLHSSLSPFSLLHMHMLSLIAPTCTNLLLQKFIAGKPPNFTHYVGYKVSCSWGEAHG